MKMKKLIFTALGVSLMFVASCCSNKQSETSADNCIAISVDSVMINAENMVNDTVCVEGVVSHLCKHGGKKAFLLGTGEDILIRCEATEEMGGAFPQETIHKPISVKGILREDRIDESVLAQLEAAHAEQVAQLAQQMDAEQLAQVSDNAEGCETERKAQGQSDIDNFSAQMADYRQKIALRDSLEGKPYISQYYIETLSYEILPE